MRRTPTISEVAKAAGVGRATAARTLGGYGYVSADARDRVLTAAQKLGYRPNRLAQSVSTGSSRTIGVVVADVSNPFFGDAVRGASELATAKGYGILLMSTYEDVENETSAVNLLVDNRVDGIILSSSIRGTGHGDILRSARDQSIPVVLLDRQISDAELDTVIINNRESVRQAVTSLISLGHSRIGFVWGPPNEYRPRWQSELSEAAQNDLWTDGERMMGYLDALADSGVELDIDLVSMGEKTEHHVREDLGRMLSMKKRPTAIFCTETEALTGTLAAIRSAGLRIPEDVSVIGFDDSSWAAVYDPPLTMIKQPTRELGAEACRLLLDRVENGIGPAHVSVLETSVVTRESVLDISDRNSD
ncbi:LacI family DNA-binding transcriptional regulator [Brevibacterium sp. FME17]|uniref:LacI family DNA-binding transcriptional regulator n=1 Tax=Brevibacterium sp. FME17 TaxID=2742606 RepID=UPI00299F878E|nr:LacI family DNA-binding transcriptional regulator [Brevibacterium sp. FME17]